MSNRRSEPGYIQLYAHDCRRGVWMREVKDAETMQHERVELCSGREGDDQYVVLKVGQTIDVEMLYWLAEVVRYAKDAKASFDPPYCICDECGKTVEM